MGLVALIAGPYTGTWSGTSVGLVDDGFRLRLGVNKELVKGDAYGDSAIDGVYRGGDVFLTLTCIEYGAAIAVFWPYGTLGVMGQVGRSDVGSTIAAATVLTVVSGTTAASTPASLTASQSIISEDYNAELAFRSGNRPVPITLRCYPYSSTGIRWFSTT